MTRARALVAAVPQQVWAAVIGLALLGSVGVALVVGAGLSTWRGAVSAPAHPPAVVVRPPASGVVVVPSHPGAPASHRTTTAPRQQQVTVVRHRAAAPTVPPVTVAPALPVVATPAPVATPPAPPAPASASPRLTLLSSDLQALLDAIVHRSAAGPPHGRALGHLMTPAAPLARSSAGHDVRRAAAPHHGRGSVGESLAVSGHGHGDGRGHPHGSGRAHGHGQAHLHGHGHGHAGSHRRHGHGH